MAKHRIGWLAGDGIGPEVMEAAAIILDALHLNAEYVSAEIGWELWRSEGEALPKRTIELLKSCHCALFGAITSKPATDAEAELAPRLRGIGLRYRSPIVRLRQIFDLYANLRPCKSYNGHPGNYREGIDLVVFRENTEGLYSGIEYYPVTDELRACLRSHNADMARFEDVAGDEMAITLRVITQPGARRILRAAFEYAQTRGYPSVTLVEKPNVLRETSGLMVRAAREIAKDYPGIALRETNIDAQVALLLQRPEEYGVLVASNLFGDILSDLAAQLTGGLGLAPSANMGDTFAVFEPTHGSAPDIAGQGKANPLAMLLATKLMLDWLGERAMAAALESAIAGVLRAGEIRTPDLGGSHTTRDVAEAVAARL
jgi:3-isopropylmalate dehydrogenase